MPTLIACLSTGQGTWTEVAHLIKAQPWDKVFLLANSFACQNFKPAPHTQLIPLDLSKEAAEIAEQVKFSLKGQIKDFEIALNLASGSGKEHMALLKAVMELGLNFRLITIKNNQLEVF